MTNTQTASSHAGDLFRVLADPTRRHLYERLVRQEDKVARLAGPLGVSQPAVSQHIAVLREAGLLSERKSGRSTFYRAEPGALAPLTDWIALQDRFWRDAILRLDDLLTESER